VTRRGRPYVRLTPDGATRELVDPPQGLALRR